jgi:hypothetical protein
MASIFDLAFDHNNRHIRAAKSYALIPLGAARRHNRKRDERDSRMFALEVATR